MSTSAAGFNEQALIHGLSLTFGGTSPGMTIFIGTVLLIVGVVGLFGIIIFAHRITTMRSRVKNVRRSTIIRPYVFPEHSRHSRNVSTSVVTEVCNALEKGDSGCRHVKGEANSLQSSASGLPSPVHEAYFKLTGEHPSSLPTFQEIPTTAPLRFKSRKRIGDGTAPAPGVTKPTLPDESTVGDERIWWNAPVTIPDTPTLERPLPFSSYTSSCASNESHSIVHSKAYIESCSSLGSIYSGDLVAICNFRFPASPPENSTHQTVPPTAIPSSPSTSSKPRPHCRAVSWHVSSLLCSEQGPSLSIINSSRPHSMSDMLPKSVTATEDNGATSDVEKLINMTRQEYHNAELARWREALKASDESYGIYLEKSWGESIREESVFITEPKATYLRQDGTSAAPRRVLGDVTNRKPVRVTVPILQEPNVSNELRKDGN